MACNALLMFLLDLVCRVVCRELLMFALLSSEGYLSGVRAG